MVLVALLNLVFNTNGEYSAPLFSWVIAGCALNVILYYVGKELDLSVSKFYFVTLLVLFVIVILNLGDDYMFNIKRSSAADVEHYIATYQGFGRSVMILGLVSVIFSKGNFKWMCFVLALSMLFLNGARSELFLFLIGTIAYVFFMNGLARGFFISFAMLCSFLLLGSIYYIANPESRIFEFINTSTSSSGSARYEMLMYSLERVFSSFGQFIGGDFGSYVEIDGIGAYPHNLFSAWHNYGFFIFLLYVLILSYFWMIVVFGNRKKGGLFILGSVLLVVNTCAFILSKDNSYFIFGLMIGIFSNKNLFSSEKIT